MAIAIGFAILGYALLTETWDLVFFATLSITMLARLYVPESIARTGTRSLVQGTAVVLVVLAVSVIVYWNLERDRLPAFLALLPSVGYLIYRGGMAVRRRA